MAVRTWTAWVGGDVDMVSLGEERAEYLFLFVQRDGDAEPFIAVPVAKAQDYPIKLELALDVPTLIIERYAKVSL